MNLQKTLKTTILKFDKTATSTFIEMKSSAGFLFTFITLKGGYFLGGAKFSGKSCLVCHEVKCYCAYNLAFSKALRVQNKAIIL